MNPPSWLLRRKLSALGSKRTRKAMPRRSALAGFELEGLEGRPLLSTIDWINPKGGDWDMPSNWQGGVVPGAGDDAVINIAGITVTHNVNATDAVHSLTSSAAISMSAGTLSLASTSTITNTLSLAGGTFTAAGSVSLNSLLWSAGTMSGPGTTTVVAGGTMTFRGTASRLLDGQTLVNAGSASWTGSANLDLADGAILDNAAGATFEDRGNGAIASSGGAASSFINAGSFLKDTLVGTTVVGVPFTNTGSIADQLGSITFTAAGSTSGTISTVSGSTVAFSGDNVTLASGASFTGAGTTWLTNTPTVTVTGASTVANLTMDSGTLTGSGTLTVANLDWTGGNMSGTGTTDATTSLAIQTNNGGYRYLTGRTLENDGIATIQGTNNGGLAMNTGATLLNEPGASLTLLNPTGFTSYTYGTNLGNVATGTIENLGSFIDASGSGVSNLGGLYGSGPYVEFAQSGTGSTEVQSGTLDFDGGGTLGGSGAITADAGATLEFGGGTFAVAATTGLGGAGTLEVSGGEVDDSGNANPTLASTLALLINGGTINLEGPSTVTVAKMTESAGLLAGPADVVVTDPILWIGGNMSGTGTTDATTSLTIQAPTSGYSLYLTGRTLENDGVATIQGYYGGGLAINTNASLINEPAASLTLLDAVGFQSYTYGTSLGDVSTGTIENLGTFVNESGSGTSNLGGGGSGAPYVTFNDAGAGSVVVQSGELLINGGGASTGSASFGTSGGSLVFDTVSPYSLGGQTAITGPGVFIQGGTVRIDGNVSATNLELDSGAITGARAIAVGNFNWVGGTLNGTGQFTVTGTFGLPGNVERDVIGWTLNAQGTTNLNTTGLTKLESGATWDNSGTFDWQGSGTIEVTGATTTWSNSGTMILDGSGTIDVTGGSNWTNSGNFTFDGAGVVEIQSAFWTSGGTSLLDGSGAIQLSGAEWLVTGTTTWTGSDPIQLSQSEWSNSGELDWQGAGSLVLSDYSEIVNLATGTLNVTDDQPIPNTADPTHPSNFENLGSVTIGGAAGTMEVDVPWVRAVFR